MIEDVINLMVNITPIAILKLVNGCTSNWIPWQIVRFKVKIVIIKIDYIMLH